MISKYKQFYYLLQNNFNIIEIDDQDSIGQSEEICYIHFNLKEMPQIQIVVDVEFKNDVPTFSVCSVWHGNGARKSRFSDPPSTDNFDKIIEKIHQMIEEYLDCSDKAYALNIFKFYETSYNL